jgi:hypothetical protein
MITINGVEIAPIQGLQGTDTITDDLETIVFNYDSEGIDGFSPFDIAHINMPGLVKDMIVAEDSGSTIQRNPIEYRHTVTLIEPTKYLEKITAPAMAFTNRSDKLVDQINKLFSKVELKTNNYPSFRLTNALVTFLGDTPGEDFYFQPNNLRNVLDEMLSVKGIRCKVKVFTTYDAIYIDYVDQNAIRNKIETIKAVERTRTQNIEYLAGNIETYAENALSGVRKTIIHPSAGTWDTLRTTEPILTSENAQLIFKFEVEEITKFIVKCQVTYTCYGRDANNLVVALGDNTQILGTDLSAYMLDKARWDLLDVGSNDSETLQRYALVQKNTIYYEKGSAAVKLGTYKLLFGFTGENIKNAIGNEMNNHVYDFRYNGQIPEFIKVISIEPSTTDILFRAEYIPQITAHAKIGKQNITNPILAKTSMYDNQSEKTIDLTRLGANLYGKINRTGNKEMTVDDILDRKVYSLSNLLQPGDLLYNEYFIVSRQFSIDDSLIKAQYKLSKDYNNISERISINRERRLYSIPLENLKRDILIKDYIIASTVQKVVVKPSLLASAGIGVFLSTFANQEQKPLAMAVVQTITDADVTYGPFELGFYSFAMANTLNFRTRFYDNYSVGFSIQAKNAQIIGGKKVVHNRYVDDIGEFETMDIRLVSGNGAYIPALADQIAAAKALPKTNLDYYAGNFLSNVQDPYVIKKDGYENPEISYIVEGRPSLADSVDNTIILGFALFTQNHLLGFADKAIKVYASTEKYSPYETKVKGTDVTQWIEVIVGSFTIAVIDPSYMGFTEGVVAWAIGDGDGNLFMACNDITKRTIYFYGSTVLL